MSLQTFGVSTLDVLASNDRRGWRSLCAILIALSAGDIAQAQLSCRSIFGWFKPTPTLNSAVIASEPFSQYVGKRGQREIEYHVKSKGESFLAEARLLAERLPSDPKSIETQALELDHLHGVIDTFQRAKPEPSRSQGALTTELARRFLALSLKQGTYVERQNAMEALANRFRSGEVVDEAKLLRLELDYVMRRRGGFGLLHELAAGARSPTIRVRAFLKLAELSEFEQAAPYSLERFDPLDFHVLATSIAGSGVSPKELTQSIRSWPDKLFERFVSSGPMASLLGPQNLAPAFEGRSAGFLARFFYKSPAISESAVRATIGDHGPETLAVLSDLVRVELRSANRRNPKVLFAIVDALGARTDSHSFELLGQIEREARLTLKEPAVSGAAAMARMLFRRKEGPEGTILQGQTIGDLPQDERDQLIVNARSSQRAEDRVRYHLRLLARGETQHLTPTDLMQMTADGRQVNLSPESIRSLVLSAPEPVFTGWVNRGGLEPFGTEEVTKLLRSRPFSTVQPLLNHKESRVRSAATASLIGNKEIGVVPALEALVIQELSTGGPRSTGVLLAAVEALKMRADPLSRKILETIIRQAPADCSNAASRSLSNNIHQMKSALGHDLWELTPSALTQRTLEGLSSDRLIDQENAAQALAFLPVETRVNSQVLAPFAKALDSPHETVRIAAVTALVNRLEPAARQLAIRVSTNRVEFTEVGKIALKALKQLEHVEADHAISVATRHPNERIRREALSLQQTPTSAPANRDIAPLSFLEKWGEDIREIPLGLLHERDAGMRMAATLAYLYPEPGPGKTGQVLAEEFVRLEAMLPVGETLVNGGCDLPSSFKWYASASRRDGRKVLTIGIAGSQTKTDWLIDGNFGVKQLTNREFRTMRNFAQAKLSEGYVVEIGGHSLGGVATQALAYDLVLKDSPNISPNSVKFATFNGLGAVTALKHLRRYVPEVAAKLKGTNYRFSGDVVSRIGPQIGPSISLSGFWTRRLGGLLGSVAQLLPATYSDHLIGKLDLTMEMGVNTFVPMPGGVRTSWLAPRLYYPVGLVTESIAALGYRIFRKQYLTQLQEANLWWARNRAARDGEGAFQPFQREMAAVTKEMEGSTWVSTWVQRSMESFRKLREAALAEGAQQIQQTQYSMP